MDSRALPQRRRPFTFERVGWIMRRLMWFTIGFAIACAFSAWVITAQWAALPLCAAAIAILMIKSTDQYHWSAMLLLGSALGMIWYSVFCSQYLDCITHLDQKQQEVCITASDYSWEIDYGTALDGWTLQNGKYYRVRAYLDDTKDIIPGERVTGTFHFQLTAADSYGSYHVGNGIFLLAYQDSEVIYSTPEKISLFYYPAVLSAEIERTLQACFPQDTASFAKALLLGDTPELGYEVDTALKVSGIRHIVAVSGLHVAILFALLQIVTLKRTGLTALLGIPMLVLFAALAGFSPSVNRACLMCGLMILGRLINKEYDGATALAFSVFVMLMVNPLAVNSVSLQLSVSSVASIFLFHRPFYEWMLTKFPDWKRYGRGGKLIQGAAASISVTVSAMVLTTPLCAYHFGAVSLVGPLTNVLVLWVISFVFYGILAVCALNLVWGSGAVLLARIVSLPIRYVLFCAETLASFPLAAVYTRSVYITFWLIFCYILLGAFWIFKRKGVRLLAGCMLVSLLMSVMLSWVEPLMHNTRMTMLDVGQGQSIILQSEGRTYLVDCGGDSDSRAADAVAETLISQGISRIDGVIVTHFDSDHSGGLENLLKRMDVDLLILPQMEDNQNCPTVDLETILVGEDIILENGKTEISIFGPGYLGSGNENSLCILFEGENCAILITGDRSDLGEQILLRKANLPKLDVLVAGHHGSADSTGKELLLATEPEIVMISVGKNNGYGHPSPQVMQRLFDFGCQVYRTDLHGTIVFRR